MAPHAPLDPDALADALAHVASASASAPKVAQDTAPRPADEGPVARTPRLVLRPLGPQDLDALHDIFSRDDVQRYIQKQQLTRAERIPWLTLRSSPPAFNFALHLRGPDGQPDGPAIGALGSPRHIPMVGYGLHPAHWGRGLVTEALGAFEALFWAWAPSASQANSSNGGNGVEGVECIRGTPGPMASALAAGPAYDYLHAFVNVDNIGSRRVLEKAGYTLVSELHKVFEGEWVDVFRFAKARPGMSLADVGIVPDV